jgi:formate C-acetyltransferase
MGNAGSNMVRSEAKIKYLTALNQKNGGPKMSVQVNATKIHRQPSTLRTQQLKQAYMENRPNICADRSVLVTESYAQTEAMHPVLRQAMAFDRVLSEMPLWIHDGELIVGNIASRPRGVFLFPEYDNTWLEQELDTISTRIADPWVLPDEDKHRLRASMQYWPGKNLAAFINAITSDEVKQYEKFGFGVDMAKEGGIGHIAADIEGVITQGLNAFIEAAESHIARLDLTNADDYEKLHFLKATIIADKAVIKWAGRFAGLAREKAASEPDEARRLELERIADICDWVPFKWLP